MNWHNAPGPGDLDAGPAWCMGGACPHDHDEDGDVCDCEQAPFCEHYGG